MDHPEQTSGLPNCNNYLGDDVRYYDSHELLDVALQHPGDFAPGTSWKYSNINYILAGLLIQKIPTSPSPKRSTDASSNQ
ncbi:serine hydrolase domain-containing protein [Rhodococcus globerulus]|uniref:Serine hydrolase domain-containing protein n=1 Tax=Rhodococcus globerulus TaxID=33008 RepID=A0ABU4C426_RHOGO|nr:serine hydrolase domain-containing protein [Rhodococcus globerulus]MDV6271255.1 serine hydrolase domain-containing protein [Rhodococcus globerulus]